MRTRHKGLYDQLTEELIRFDKDVHPLLGIRSTDSRDVLVKQLIDSIRRVSFVRTLGSRQISPRRADPNDQYFDPLRAALVSKNRGEIDEAFWLTFLSVHFGKHATMGWKLAASIYGALNQSPMWTWNRIANETDGFKDWLDENYHRLRSKKLTKGFGNHRKYCTLNPESTMSTTVVFESYIKWVGPHRSHEQLMRDVENQAGKSSKTKFDYLYKSMDSVVGFGRLGKFDYLTMLTKLGLAQLEPGSIYLNGSTGPVKGARLLFGNSVDADLGNDTLESYIYKLESHLSLGVLGMQVLEDGLCNWQKSPLKYKLFRG